MHLEIAERKKAKIKMAIQGPSGSGKTKGALLVAYGLTGDWSKIVVLDTENKSAHLYSHLGAYRVLSIASPFSPERYAEAINYAVSQNMEVIIIDTISSEWDGIGGITQIHSDMAGNSFTNWNALTPRHDMFVQAMLQCPVHVIATIRSKQDYVLVNKDGKMVPEKVGMKPITRDGMEYDFTLVFELDIKHYATTSKDRTEAFMDKPPFRLSAETGKLILAWCNEGLSADAEKQRVMKRISTCKSLGELFDLFNLYPNFQQSLKGEFSKKRSEIELSLQSHQIVQQVKTSSNGTHK